jgi:hypothetical protein
VLRHFWDAAVEEDPAARNKDQGERFSLCAAGALTSAFESAGLSSVVERSIDVTDRFANFEDYWTPFLSGEAPAPGYLATLPPDRQAIVKELLMARVPVAADGSITFTCRAWAARGRLAPKANAQPA